MRHPGPTLVICVVLLALPAAAGTFKGECADSVTLGHERWPELKKLRAELRERLAVADYTGAVELQREIASMQCHNHFLRYYLVELMVQAGDAAGAVEVLDGLYQLGVNDLEERLADPASPLHPLAASDAFADSALARRIAAERAEYEERQARFRSRLDALAADGRPASATSRAGCAPSSAAPTSAGASSRTPLSWWRRAPPSPRASPAREPTWTA